VTEGQAASGTAADLGAIRRSDEVIDLLASRRRLCPRVLRDPAVAVLASLIADIDAPGARSRPAGARYGTAAAAAAAVAAALLAAAGFVVVVMLTCLGGPRGRHAARGWTGTHRLDRSRGRGGPGRP
jgi:hypothetical protein